MNTSNNKKTVVADSILIMVAIIWGIGFPLTKSVLEHLTPLYFVAIRFWLAFIILFVIFMKKLKNTTFNEIKCGALVGLMLYLGFVTQTMGMQFTTAGKSAFLTGTNVVMVPFICWILFKERPDKFSVISAIICFLGIISLTVNEKLSGVNIGDILTLVCAVSFACHIILTGHFVKNIDIIKFTMIQFLTVAILASISAFIVEPPLQAMPLKANMLMIFSGIVSTCLCFLLQTFAQKYTSSTHTSIILSTEAVFGSLLSVIFLGELFTINMIVGSVAILLAIITAETKWEFLYKKRILPSSIKSYAKG